MRQLRAPLVAGFATAALALPSSALAQIDSQSVSDARLGPEGLTIAMTVTFQCEPGWVVEFGVYEVAQSTGKKLAVGSGLLFFGTNGDPCTGAPPVGGTYGKGRGAIRVQARARHRNVRLSRRAQSLDRRTSGELHRRSPDPHSKVAVTPPARQNSSVGNRTHPPREEA